MTNLFQCESYFPNYAQYMFIPIREALDVILCPCLLCWASEHSIQTTLCSLVGKGRMEKVFKLRMWQHFLIVFINFAAHT